MLLRLPYINIYSLYMNTWIRFFRQSSLITTNIDCQRVPTTVVVNIASKENYQLFLSFNPVINVHELEQLYDLVGWVRRPPRKVQLAINNSFLILTLYLERKGCRELVGFARAISDHAFNATIWDMAIHPDFQHQGLGSILMGKIIQELRYVEIDSITLFADSQSIRFYSKLGFIVDPLSIKGMFWYPQ